MERFDGYAQLTKGVILMLNTQLTSSLPKTPPPPVQPPASNPKKRKRRGGQPGNHNARKHGLYAARHPHPAAALIKSAAFITRLPGSDPASISSQVETLRMINLGLLETLESVSDSATYLALVRHILRNISAITNLVMAQYALGAEQRLLLDLASQTGLLVNWEFRANRISPHPVFVPHSFENLSHLSTFCGGANPSGAFLTDRHWFILESLFTELHAEREEEARIYGRPRPRRSPYPDRFVLDGVLWKLAAACRWDQLPPEYPVRRCQRLYRELYNTGRMAAIYDKLLLDLHAYGDTTLESLVEGGEYRLHAGKIIYLPKATPDWQHVVALLLLQRACFNFRKLKRENRAERRRRGHYLRLPPLPSLRFRPARSQRLPKPNPPPPPGTFTVPPAHNHPLLRRPRFIPLENSHAWAKWVALQSLNGAIRAKLEDP
jgi:transposase